MWSRPHIDAPFTMLLVAGAAVGCASAPGSSVDERTQDEDTGSVSQPIINGFTIAAPNSGHVDLDVAVTDGIVDCSGTLLRNRWVLTARHCFTDYPGATAGGTTVRMASETRMGTAVYLHPTRDLALLLVTSGFTMNGSNVGYFRPLHDGAAASLVGSRVYCRGYGPSSTNGSGGGTLRGDAMNVEQVTADLAYLRIAPGYVAHGWQGDSGGGCFLEDPVGGSGMMVSMIVGGEFDWLGNYQRDVTVPVTYVRDWALTTMAYQENYGRTRYRLQNVATGKCLNAGYSAGANAFMDACASIDEEAFYVAAVGSGIVEIVSRRYGKCLEVANGSQAEYGNVVTSACDGAAYQHWYLDYVGSSEWRVRASHSGRCLYGGTSQGSPAVQVACLGNAYQRWRFTVAY